MTKLRLATVLVCFVLLSLPSPFHVQAPSGTAVDGEWIFTSVELGIRDARRLELTSAGPVLTAKFYIDDEHQEAKGTVNESKVRLEHKSGDQTIVYEGTWPMAS